MSNNPEIDAARRAFIALSDDDRDAFARWVASLGWPRVMVPRRDAIMNDLTAVESLARSSALDGDAERSLAKRMRRLTLWARNSALPPTDARARSTRTHDL